MTLLDIPNNPSNLCLVTKVELQDRGRVCAREAGAYNIPACAIESLHDLSAQQTSCAGDQDILCHDCSCGSSIYKEGVELVVLIYTPSVATPPLGSLTRLTVFFYGSTSSHHHKNIIIYISSSSRRSAKDRPQ